MAIPKYAETPDGSENWVQKEKSTERSEHYKSLYEKAKTQAQLDRVKLNFETNSAINGKKISITSVKSNPKMTLGNYLKDEVLKGNSALMLEALNHLQGQGYEVDFFPEGYTAEVIHNRLSIYEDTSEGREFYVSPETSVAVHDLEVLPFGRADEAPRRAEDKDRDEERDEDEEEEGDDEEMTLDEKAALLSEKLEPRQQKTLRLLEKSAAWRSAVTANPDALIYKAPADTHAAKAGSQLEISLNKNVDNRVNITWKVPEKTAGEKEVAAVHFDLSDNPGELKKIDASFVHTLVKNEEARLKSAPPKKDEKSKAKSEEPKKKFTLTAEHRETLNDILPTHQLVKDTVLSKEGNAWIYETEDKGTKYRVLLGPTKGQIFIRVVREKRSENVPVNLLNAEDSKKENVHARVKDAYKNLVSSGIH